MIKSYFKVAWRNLLRNKGFAIMNIAGLAVGLASSLLIFLVVRYEYSYNTSQANYERIFHIYTADKSSDGIRYTPGIPFPALQALRTDFPGITTGALLANFGSQVTVLNDQQQQEQQSKFIELSGFFFADPDFFRVFQYEWIQGDPASLARPNVTVLTKSTAEKYFGNWQEAIGRNLLLDNAITVTVAGVLADPPINTDYPIKIVSSFETIRSKANDGVYFYSDQWGATTSNFNLFMLLPEHMQSAVVQEQLLAFSKKYYPFKTIERTNFIRPLSSVHFDQRFDSFGDHTTNKSTLLTLILISIFIIVMACINFVNLSTAQSVSRSKEIGMRKVLGAFRRQLFFQIIGETFLVVLLALVFAVAISLLCLPGIRAVANIPEPLSVFDEDTILAMCIVLLTLPFLAGFYPAMIISRFKPALALKSRISSLKTSVRRSLVIIQFVISQVLIIGTIIAVVQMNFVSKVNLGFDKDAVLVIHANIDSVARTRQQFFKEQLLQLPGVASVTYSSDVPSSQNTAQTNFDFDLKSVTDFNVSTKEADEDYFKTFGIDFAAGRPYRKSDSLYEVVINETFMNKLGHKEPESILHKTIQLGESSWMTIVGVVKDFKTNTLKENVQPLVLLPAGSRYYVTSVKLKKESLLSSRKDVEARWNRVFPEYAFTSTFMDESIENFYRQDKQLSLLYKIFAGIAIFLFSLGLYGLVTFMAIQKRKEIGVRKVLGASVSAG